MTKKLVKIHSKNAFKVNISHSPGYISSLFFNDFKKIIYKNKV